MSDKSAYQRKLDARVDELDADITKLKAQARRKGADAEIDFNRRLEALDRQREDAAEKLESLRASGGDAWQDLKVGVERAVGDLAASISSARSRF